MTKTQGLGKCQTRGLPKTLPKKSALVIEKCLQKIKAQGTRALMVRCDHDVSQPQAYRNESTLSLSPQLMMAALYF